MGIIINVKRSEIIVITKLVFINMLITIKPDICVIIIFMTLSGVLAFTKINHSFIQKKTFGYY